MVVDLKLKMNHGRRVLYYILKIENETWLGCASLLFTFQYNVDTINTANVEEVSILLCPIADFWIFLSTHIESVFYRDDDQCVKFVKVQCSGP